MAIEVDTLACLMVSPIEDVMSMVVPQKDCRTFWAGGILPLLMILVCYQMLMSFVKMGIDGYARNILNNNTLRAQQGKWSGECEGMIIGVPLWMAN